MFFFLLELEEFSQTKHTQVINTKINKHPDQYPKVLVCGPFQ